VTRPRAADDFAAIRARLEELHRDRTRVWANNHPSPDPQPPGADNKSSSAAEKPRLSPTIRRVLYRSAPKMPGE
jgi:hypothetical protein